MRVVIVGAGDVGSHLAAQLSLKGSEVVLMDRDPDALAIAEEQADVLTSTGDGTHRSLLRAAGVSKADLLVAVTGNDDTNLVCAALAASLGARSTVARVDSPSFYDTDRGIERGVLGVDVLLCASRLISEELVRLVLGTMAEAVASFAGNSIHVAITRLDHRSPGVGLSAEALKTPTGVALRAVVRDGLMRQPFEINRLEVDDGLLLSGNPASLMRACRELHSQRTDERAVLVGGGDVGLQLARTLVAAGNRVQVFERDMARCEVLAETLPEINVLHADGTSISRMRDERVGDSALLLAVTRRDEANLMASLLAANLGTKHTFSLVHRPGYADVYEHLGIRGSAGVHHVIAQSVSWLMPRDGAFARRTLPGCAHELLELRLPEGTPSDLTWAQLAVPPGVIAVAASRDLQALSTEGKLRLCAGDHVVFAVPSSSQRALLRRIDALREGGG